jgi:hypothetical protein
MLHSDNKFGRTSRGRRISPSCDSAGASLQQKGRSKLRPECDGRSGLRYPICRRHRQRRTMESMNHGRWNVPMTAPPTVPDWRMYGLDRPSSVPQAAEWGPAPALSPLASALPVWPPVWVRPAWVRPAWVRAVRRPRSARPWQRSFLRWPSWRISWPISLPISLAPPWPFWRICWPFSPTSWRSSSPLSSRFSWRFFSSPSEPFSCSCSSCLFYSFSL